jgi:hypothetical protein
MPVKAFEALTKLGSRAKGGNDYRYWQSFAGHDPLFGGFAVENRLI